MLRHSTNSFSTFPSWRISAKALPVCTPNHSAPQCSAHAWSTLADGGCFLERVLQTHPTWRIKAITPRPGTAMTSRSSRRVRLRLQTFWQVSRVPVTVRMEAASFRTGLITLSAATWKLRRSALQTISSETSEHRLRCAHLLMCTKDKPTMRCLLSAAELHWRESMLQLHRMRLQGAKRR